MAAVFAVEKYAFVVDQDREAWIAFVSPPARAFRAGGFLVAVSRVADDNPELGENFTRRHIAGLKPGGLPRWVSHFA